MTTATKLAWYVAECLRRLNAGGHNPSGHAQVQTWLDALPVTCAERANIAESARRQITLAQPSRAKYIAAC